MTPKNKLATDKEIIEAVKEHGSHALAAEALGMGKSTVSNRLSLINKRGVHVEAEVTRPDAFKKTQTKKTKRYVVTCAVSNAPVDKDFLAILDLFCKEESAELVVIPQDYQWNDAVKGRQQSDYDPLIADKLLSTDIELDKHVHIKGSYPLHCTLVNPLQGLGSASPGKSCIFGHPVRAMRAIATANDKFPLLNYTSGAITKPRYTRSKSGHKAQGHHKISAMFVESDGKGEAHFHELNYSEKYKNMQMIDKVYTKDSISFDSVAGVVCGDEHVAICDKETIDAVFKGKNSLVGVLNPEIVCHNDLFDMHGTNHHIQNDLTTRFRRRIAGVNDVEKELKLTLKHLTDNKKGHRYKSLIVPSNHTEHLCSWLNNAQLAKEDPINYEIFHYLNYLKFKGIKEGDYKHAFQQYCSEHLENYDDVIWPSRNSEYKIKGYVVSNHLDKGPNGSRGSAAGIAALGQPTIGGHSHSPCIVGCVRQVGCQFKTAGYAIGLSSWLTTNAAIYNNEYNKRQMEASKIG